MYDILLGTFSLCGTCIALMLVIYLPPWSFSYDSFDSDKEFILITLPAGSFPVLLGVGHFVTVVVSVPVAL